MDALESYRISTKVDHDHFGTEEFELASSQLKRFPNAPIEELYALRLTIGIEALKLGQNHRAVEALAKAWEMKTDPRLSLHQRDIKQLLLMLSVAWLHIAEVENCINCSNGESCLFPISSQGQHTNREGSEKSLVYLNQLLKIDPTNVVARWLFVIAHQTLGTPHESLPEKFRLPQPTLSSDKSFPRFRNVATRARVNELSLAGGAIADDFDGDHLLDLMVSNWYGSGQLRYYRNLGNGQFEDQTEAAGLIGFYAGLNLLQADYDNDGDLDVLVLRGAWQNRQDIPNSLLQNDGSGRFTEVLYSSGLGELHRATQTACWFDFNQDGLLDLFIGNEDTPSQLFQNQGNGTFVDVAERAGVASGRWVKGVSSGDYDNDGDTDLYLSILFGDNQLFRNNGDGTFTDVARKAGVTSPQAGFPTWFWDFNNDGKLDLFAASYDGKVADVAATYFFPKRPTSVEADCMYMGDGKGNFKNVAKEMGLPAVTLPMGCNFGDIDNDGFLDFYLATGIWEFEGLMPNLMFHNQEGRRFVDVSAAGGFGHLQKGHGVAFFDYDNDGDQDVFNELGGAYTGDVFQNALFENPGFGNSWVKIKLVGHRSNRCGIGARIRVDVVTSAGSRSIYRWVNSGGSFGANPLRQEIGLGKAEAIARLEVFWPASNTTQTFDKVPVGKFLEIHENEKSFRQVKLPNVVIESTE